MVSKVNLWIKENQGKHFCHCPCKGVIIIKSHHYRGGIPKYLVGHNNVGKKFSNEHKMKISISHKNKIVSDKTKQKQSKIRKERISVGLIIIWNKDKTGVYSKETLKNNSDKHKGKTAWNKGVPTTEAAKSKMRKAKENVSVETRMKISKNHHDVSGINNPRYIDGRTKIPYCEKWTKKKREEIRNQHNRKCFNCGKDEKDNLTKTGKFRRLSVHHIDGDKDQGCNGKSWKLIPLCVHCHISLHNTERVK